MKGLIFKDIYLSRKNFIICGLVFILLQIMIYILRFAYIYGNLSDPEYLSSKVSVDTIVPLLSCSILMLMLLNSVNIPIYSDFRCKWNLFMYTTEHTEKSMIKLKFIETVIVWGAASIIGLIFNLIYFAVFSNEYIKFSVICSVALYILWLLSQFIIIMLSYRHKTEQAVQLRICIGIIIPVYILCAIFIVPFMEKLSEAEDGYMIFYNKVHDFILGNFPAIILGLSAITILCGILSYKVSLKTLQRRDFICGV